MASTSSSSTPVRTYDVFLSFRGKDTRYTIVSHLYQALRLKGLFTFKDDKRIEVGHNISDRLLEAIKTSWFAVIIISANHATSTWCLEELRTIMELHKENKIEVVPIFYGVEPSDVRYQIGSFKAAFQKYDESLDMSDKVLKWRDALVQVSNLAGTHSSQW